MERLYEVLMKLPRKNLIHLMFDALDEMQTYNGRTKMCCICYAMGCKESDDGKSYTIPSLRKIKENTDSCLF